MSKKLKSLIFVTCGTDLLARRVKHIAPLSLKDKWLDPKVNKKNSQNIRYDVAGFFIPCLEIDMQYHHNFHTITNICGHYLMELSQSDHTSQLTNMSRRLKSVETTLRVTCE
jgi:hypothetical protein